MCHEVGTEYSAHTWTHMTDEATLIASYLFGSMGEPYVISLPFPPHTMSVIIVALFTSHFGSRKYPMQGCCMFNKQTIYVLSIQPQNGCIYAVGTWTFV